MPRRRSCGRDARCRWSRGRCRRSRPIRAGPRSGVPRPGPSRRRSRRRGRSGSGEAVVGPAGGAGDGGRRPRGPAGRPRRPRRPARLRPWRLGRVGPDPLGQPPVEHDDLAEVAQHDVLALEVAVDDPARMRVGHGVADADERRQQVDQPDRVGLAGGPLLVIGPDRLAQGAAPDEPHGVIRRIALAQLVDRHDPRVLELRRDLGLVEEPRADDRVVGLVGAQLLQRDLAAERAVAGQPDPAHAPLGVQVGQRVALAGCRPRPARACPARRGRPGHLGCRGARSPDRHGTPLGTRRPRRWPPATGRRSSPPASRAGRRRARPAPAPPSSRPRVRCSSVISPRSTIRSASGRVGSEAQAAQVSARPSASTAPLWKATTPKSKLRSVSMTTSPSGRSPRGSRGRLQILIPDSQDTTSVGTRHERTTVEVGGPSVGGFHPTPSIFKSTILTDSARNEKLVRVIRRVESGAGQPPRQAAPPAKARGPERCHSSDGTGLLRTTSGPAGLAAWARWLVASLFSSAVFPARSVILPEGRRRLPQESERRSASGLTLRPPVLLCSASTCKPLPRRVAHRHLGMPHPARIGRPAWAETLPRLKAGLHVGDDPGEPCGTESRRLRCEAPGRPLFAPSRRQFSRCSLPCVTYPLSCLSVAGRGVSSSGKPISK